MRVWLTIDLVSDARFPAAGGRATSLPTVSGRAIKGLLVAELAQILQAFTGRPDIAIWREAAARLFGQSGGNCAGALNIGDARLGDDIEQAVAKDAARQTGPRWPAAIIRQALSAAASRGARATANPWANAGPAHIALRAGLRFYSPVTADRELTDQERALLAGCAMAVRRAGAGRARGWGRVNVRICDSRNRDLTGDWLKGLIRSWDALLPPPATEPLALPPLPTETKPTVVSYLLRLTAPLTLPAAGHIGDPAPALRYVPGSALLGALAARFIERVPPISDVTDKTPGAGWFNRLFLSGHVRWLNAYPADARGRRLLPLPISMARGDQLSGKPTAIDGAAPGSPAHLEHLTSLSWPQLNSAGNLFAALITEDPIRAFIDVIQPETTVQRRGYPSAGLSSSADGGTCSTFEALNPGLLLAGHALCPDEQTAEVISGLLTAGPLRIGRSRSAGFGGEINVEQVSARSADDWREAPVARPLANGPLTVTFLSDCIVRNFAGQYDPAAVTDALRQALGLPEAAVPTTAFLRFRTVHGYNSAWRMPRPAPTAIAAGSVLVFDGAASDAAGISSVLWEGIGEQRQAGFGRLALNWHGAQVRWLLREIAQAEVARKIVRPPQRGVAARAPYSGLEQFQRALLDAALANHLSRLAHTDAAAVTDAPPPRVIERLADAFRMATDEPELAAAVLAVDGARAGAALACAACRGRPLREWLLSVSTPSSHRAEWRETFELDRIALALGLPPPPLDERGEFLLLHRYLTTFCGALRRAALVKSRQNGAEGGRS